jgi:type IV secretory pathway TrbF-like protein
MLARTPRLNRRLDYIEHSQGYGKRYVTWLLVLLTLAIGWATYASGVAFGRLQNDARRVERYVVTTDAEGRVLAVNTADGSLPLPSRVYVQAAERWVKLLRRRPAGASVRGSDAERLVDGWRDEARTFTNDRLWQGPLAEALYANDRSLGDKAVDFEGDPQAVIYRLQDGREDRDDWSARVLVTWTETVRGVVPETTRWTAILAMADHGGQPREAGDNPLDLWVVDYSMSHQEVRR